MGLAQEPASRAIVDSLISNFCSKCGKSIGNDRSFCSVCGNKHTTRDKLSPDDLSKRTVQFQIGEEVVAATPVEFFITHIILNPFPYLRNQAVNALRQKINEHDYKRIIVEVDKDNRTVSVDAFVALAKRASVSLPATETPRQRIALDYLTKELRARRQDLFNSDDNERAIIFDKILKTYGLMHELRTVANEVLINMNRLVKPGGIRQELRTIQNEAFELTIRETQYSPTLIKYMRVKLSEEVSEGVGINELKIQADLVLAEPLNVDALTHYSENSSGEGSVFTWFGKLFKQILAPLRSDASIPKREEESMVGEGAFGMLIMSTANDMIRNLASGDKGAAAQAYMRAVEQIVIFFESSTANTKFVEGGISNEDKTRIVKIIELILTRKKFDQNDPLLKMLTRKLGFRQTVIDLGNYQEQVGIV
jgi:hypothetical protein